MFNEEKLDCWLAEKMTYVVVIGSKYFSFDMPMINNDSQEKRKIIL